MTNPLDTLRKMLQLEQKDYKFQDKAVAGGLARYTGTWLKQAKQAYSKDALPWIEDVAHRMEAYSSLQPESRREALVALLAVLESGPAESGAAPPLPPPKPTAKGSPAPASKGRGANVPVQAISGVGQKRGELLEKLGVKTVRDLLFLYPRRYEDYSELKTINQLRYGETVSVIGTVWEAGGRKTRGPYLFKAIVGDNTGTLEVTWFNQPHLQGRIQAGMQIVLSGKVDEYLGRLTMNAPEWERLGRSDLDTARIVPIYPLTEGLTQRALRRYVQRALAAWADRLPDPLPEEVRRAHHLLSLSQALRGIHFPDSKEHLKAARRRLAFEEALYLQLGLLRRKLQWKSVPGRVVAPPEGYRERVRETLPYELTGAQQRALDEMLRDVATGEPMNRLLQGDVGSGKTVVAAILMAVTASVDHQVAMMAPTEILAEQHYKSLSRLFETFPEPRPSVRLLTGSVKGEEREEIYAGLADGTVDVVVGTHALIQGEVVFADLALVVIDEQHRFGVEQRGALRQKGYNPHLLVMTATPIPRSLELTFWGHLDVSTLDEMPPGRQAVKTRVIYPKERERAYTFIRSQVEKGRQAFIIYPLVEESDKIKARSAVEEYARLQQQVFPDLKLALLHGQMRPDAKDEAMARFVAGERDVLVATSVVEVGIDVPNATVMLIDGAERFGLAQLHQFRGRVGRGEHQSYCLLLAESASEVAQERLRAVEATTDGFLLAEKDLEMRGPGEFLGTRQSGLPELPMVELVDTRLLHEVRETAQAVLEEDPELSEPAHQGLARHAAQFWEETGDVS